MRTGLQAMTLLALAGAALAGSGHRGPGAPMAYLEDFESYGPGPLPASAGWRVDNPQTFRVISVGALSGVRSARHDGLLETSGSWDVETPAFGPGYGVLRMLVAFGERSWYQLGVTDPETTYFVAWIELGETIRVGRSEIGREGFGIADSGVLTPSNATAELAVEVRPSGKLRVRLDGALIHEGVETHRTLFGSAGRMGRLHIKTTGETITFDDIRFEPLALAADLDEDGVVGTKDLGSLIGAWGPCATGVVCPGDVNGDGNVDSRDLAQLLGQWSG